MCPQRHSAAELTALTALCFFALSRVLTLREGPRRCSSLHPPEASITAVVPEALWPVGVRVSPFLWPAEGQGSVRLGARAASSRPSPVGAVKGTGSLVSGDTNHTGLRRTKDLTVGDLT